MKQKCSVQGIPEVNYFYLPTAGFLANPQQFSFLYLLHMHMLGVNGRIINGMEIFLSTKMKDFPT